MRHIKSLDGVRGIAISLVLLGHVYYVWAGHLGVEAFFVLSGFLITTILLDLQRDNLGQYLKIFYFRRILRIFPVYFAFLFICLLLYWTLGNVARLRTDWPYLITYTTNVQLILPGYKINYLFSHLWSLAAEEQFYFIWPLLIFFAARQTLKKVIVVIIVLAPLLRLVISLLFHDRAPLIIYHLTLTQADAFAWGAAVAVFDTNFIKRPTRVLSICALIVLFAGACNLIAIFYYHPSPLPASSGLPPVILRNFIHRLSPYYLTSLGYPAYMVANYQHVWGYTLINCFSALLVLVCITGGASGSVLENRFVLHVGKISYCMYVIHPPVLVAIRNYFPINFLTVRGFVFVAFYFTLIVVISSISYSYFESKFLALKSKLASAKKPTLTVHDLSVQPGLNG